MAIAGGSTAFSAETAARRAVWSIAVATGIASFAMNFWIPFIPLLMKDLGASSDANAVFWAGLATASVGVARLVSGPVWGILSDKYGRKLMFVRALGFASVTTLIAAFAQAPWQVVAALAFQGLFSGFIPAAVALTSVTVPDWRLSGALGQVSAAQYLGTTVGPAIGGGIALALGFRGAIVAAAVMPALAAAVVFFTVPRDVTAPAPKVEGAAPLRPGWRSLLGWQFVAVIVFYFFIFGTNQLVRISTPVALDQLSGQDPKALAGIAFTTAGVASVVGLLVVGRGLLKPGRFRWFLAAACLASAVTHVGLALAGVPWTYIAAFAAVSLFNGIMVPAINTMVAAQAGRERRGTAFGIASTAQAAAFIVGPLGAAFFAATSLEWGLMALAGAFVFAAAGALLLLREPKLEGAR